MASSRLYQKIISRIRQDGAIGIADYMEICLADSQDGYYRSRDPLGKQGDFTTAPEISQIFGELVGAWILTLWDMTGRPSPFHLVEMGPGRGTLMSDILRTSRLMPDFIPNTRLHFVETSPVLRKKQAQAVQGFDTEPLWHEQLETVPDGRTVLVANEFLDALPVRHFIKQGKHWHERLVGLDNTDSDTTGRLVFHQSPQKCDLAERIPIHPDSFSDGDILEYRPAHEDFVRQLANRAQKGTIAALVIDYGHAKSGPGDTFQAMKAHRYTDPLKTPGEADLTAHVDFEDLGTRAIRHGLKTHGPITQGQFLMSLGLARRAEKILQTASADEARLVTTGVQRLIDPTQMGNLFKVMVITSPGFPTPPPFTAQGFTHK